MLEDAQSKILIERDPQWGNAGLNLIAYSE